jgi:Flp pilus assembly protein TadD
MDPETIVALTPICKYLVIFAAVVVALYVLREPLKRLLDRLIAVRLKTRALEAELSAPAFVPTTAPAADHYQEQVPPEDTPRPGEGVGPAGIEPATAAEWVQKMLAAFRDGDWGAAEAAFAETQKAEDDPVKKLQYEALYASCRYEQGDTSALAELRQLAEKEGVATIAYPLLGQCYENFGDFDNAAKAYELAAHHASSEEERARIVVRAASCVFKGGRQQDAYTMLMSQISDSTTTEALSVLYDGLASLYELAEDPELCALALEKALEIKPNDARLRFRAGYSYGEKHLDHLALLHYKTLVRFDPDDTGSLNNLGVAYSRLDMPIRAIESFEAAGGNETLAAANLAEAYIAGGFKRRATELIDQARRQEQVHARVGVAMEEISEREETEANAERAVLQAAREQQRFLLSFASAYFTADVAARTFADTWVFPDGVEATIVQTDHEIKGDWTRDKKKYRFTGRVNNRGAKITRHRMQYATASGQELGFTDDGEGYAYMSPDGMQLPMMTLKGHEHSLETLTRSEGDF